MNTVWSIDVPMDIIGLKTDAEETKENCWDLEAISIAVKSSGVAYSVSRHRADSNTSGCDLFDLHVGHII